MLGLEDCNRPKSRKGHQATMWPQLPTNFPPEAMLLLHDLLKTLVPVSLNHPRCIKALTTSLQNQTRPRSARGPIRVDSLMSKLNTSV